MIAEVLFAEQGVAIAVSDTTTKVEGIVQDHLVQHWDTEQIQRKYPYLTLAKIHAALTYCYDHQQEIDADIDPRLRLVEGIRSAYYPRTSEPWR